MLKFWKKKEAAKTHDGDSRGGHALKMVLHVGPHKTGTTSLQRALLKQYGSEVPRAIWYPLPEESGPGHAHRAWKMLGQKGWSPSPSIRQLVEQAEEAPACRCLIISSEVFAGTFPDRIEPLIEQTSGTDLHIVVTLSPIGRRAVSAWQEMVKNRSLVSLDDARDVIFQRSGFSPLYVRYFAEHFPEARLSVVIADRSAPKKLFKLFGDATGIALVIPNRERELVANRSFGLIEVQVLSAFNASAQDASLTLDNYRKARSLLRDQFESEAWRAVVPMIPLTLPGDWISPLRERCIATVADLKELQAQGRIAVFGDIESLDDLETRPEDSDTPHSGKELA